MPPFVIPDQQAPLTITEMTLRGIGSYLQGARLKFEPLTVLCGKNGSGKSTWLKALNLLRESLKAGRMPYSLAWDLTNAFHLFATPDKHAESSREGDEEKFGPPGTIGLEIDTAREYVLPSIPHDDPLIRLPDCTNEVHEFLWNGRCAAGSRFRLRIAHPGYEVDSAETPQLVDLIELKFNDEYVLRLEGPREPAQEVVAGQLGPRRSFPYTLSCSSAFLPKTHQYLDPNVDIGELTDINRRRWTALLDGIDANYATTLLDHFEARFRQILERALGGVFHVGAIRRVENAHSLESRAETEATQIVQRRHVGTAGEFSWLLERSFAGNRMRSIEIEKFRPEHVESNLGRILDLLRADELSVGRDDPRVKRIRDLAPKALWERIAHAAASQAHSGQIAVLLAEYLNGVLDSPDLFDRNAWEHHFGVNNGRLGLLPDPQIQDLGEKGVSNLSPRRLWRLNALLVRDTLTLGQEDALFDAALAETKDTYPLVSYVSAWLNQLVDASLTTVSTREKWQKHFVARAENPTERQTGGNVVPLNPTGLLLAPQSPSPFVEEPGDALSRVLHPCFGREHFVPFGLGEGQRTAPQPPRQISAGFHQIFPILMQLGLMKAGELLAIENPEVHLHPGLQLKLTETLIKHISSGRRLIIETHSDLVVRRVLRAIMQEEDGLSQSQVGIYFADLKREEFGYDYSTLTPLEINDNGQIANWPEGFMDDDVKESQRLLDIMYGASKKTCDYDE